MFIQTEQTPNPKTLKFIPGLEVMNSGTLSFADRESAKKSPLAEALFAIKNIEGVFFGSDFITITRNADVEWDILKPAILTTIMEHFVSGRPLISGDSKEIRATSTASAEDSDMVKQIKELIDTRVRPAVAEDGGDIVYQDFRDGIVYLELHGACSGCPSSTATLKSGIENMLKHYIPEIEAVEAVNG